MTESDVLKAHSLLEERGKLSQMLKDDMELHEYTIKISVNHVTDYTVSQPLLIMIERDIHKRIEQINQNLREMGVKQNEENNQLTFRNRPL